MQSSIRLHKYRFYFLMLALVTIIGCSPGIYRLLVYKKVAGKVVRVDVVPNKRISPKSATAYFSSYATIEFSTDSLTAQFTSSRFASPLIHEGDGVKVLYDPDNPTDAHLMSVLGLFGYLLVWLSPLYLIGTGIFFAPKVLPTYLVIRWWRILPADFA